ncbi:DUF4258 domain-containing protein [Candidatus Micrarchaeota archaeon]|nr:DUF4258 domain-containing protein [Candidatus Micrarchaeota archaeon]
MLRISAHTLKRMKKRNVSEEDIVNAINNGEETYENTDEGKYANRSDFGNKYLIVIWRYEGEGKEVVTVYWLNRKLPKYRFIE